MSTKKLEPVTWQEIKNFYKENFNETIPEEYEDAFTWAWSQTRQLQIIDFYVTGYQAAKNKYQPQ